jgi:hypothetical protein
MFAHRFGYVALVGGSLLAIPTLVQCFGQSGVVWNAIADNATGPASLFLVFLAGVLHLGPRRRERGL